MLFLSIPQAVVAFPCVSRSTKRVILPISDSINIPSRFGLRHRAAFGVSEKTDAVCLLVSEETGEISYIKDGNFELYADYNELLEKLKLDIQ